MVNYGNPLETFDHGWSRSQGIFDHVARLRAGSALSKGQIADARNIFFKSGMIDEGRQLEADRVEAKERGRRIGSARAAERKTQQKETLGYLKQVATTLRKVPADQRDAAFKQLEPALQFLGPQVLEQMRSAPKDDSSLDFFIGDLERAELEIVRGSDGSYTAVDKGTGRPVYRQRGTTPLTLKPGENVYMPEDAFEGAPSVGEDIRGPWGGPPGVSRPQESGPSADETFGALKMQESGNRPGAIGPQTRYGRAQGSTQMLPATAEEMASKLGVEWRPELMTGTTPEAAAYQERLGRAYFDEGLDKYGGDIRKALMYYHGGPDERLWGPKTRAYADAVLARTQSYGVAANGQTPGRGAPQGAPEIPGYRLVQAAQNQGADWRQLSREESAQYGEGVYQQNMRTGQVQQIAGSAPSSQSRPPTDGQRQTVAFAFRTMKANDRMNALADRGIFKPQTATAQLFDTDKNGVVRVITKTAEDRQFIQAAKEWLAPVLRKDTGAAVTDAELATYMDIFIPKYEDDNETLKQKAHARFDTMTALLAQSGDLYDKTHGARPYEVKYPGSGKKKPRAAPGGGHGARQQRQSLDKIFGD